MFRSLYQARLLWLHVAVLGVAPAAIAADAPAWATGPELKRQLATPLSISWENAPLSRALAGLSTSQHVAIVLDRRIDPQQPLELAIENEPLSDALAKLARHLKIGYCQLGPVAYLGPAETAQRLRTAAALRREEVIKLPKAAQRKFLLQKSWHWDRLAEPRDLARLLAAEAGAELLHEERIPHDLWPAADLPPLSWIDRMTLVAAEFGLTFRIADSGRRVELVSLPEEVVLSRTYLGGRDAEAAARRWSEALPEAKITAAGGKIRVAARLEDHEQIEQRLRGTPTRRTTVTAGKEMYQLQVEKAALDKVVEQLARQLNLSVQWDHAAIERADIAVNQLVTVKVANVELDQLLGAVFAGTGLSFTRNGRSLTVAPK